MILGMASLAASLYGDASNGSGAGGFFGNLMGGGQGGMGMQGSPAGWSSPQTGPYSQVMAKPRGIGSIDDYMASPWWRAP